LWLKELPIELEELLNSSNCSEVEIKLKINSNEIKNLVLWLHEVDY
jgi:hypothetical protein